MRPIVRSLAAGAALALAAAAPAAPLAAQPLRFDDLADGAAVGTYEGLVFSANIIASTGPLTVGAGPVSGSQLALVGPTPFGYGEIYSPGGTFNGFTGWLGYRSALPTSAELFVTLAGSAPDGREFAQTFAITNTMRWLEFRAPFALDALYLETAALDLRPEGVVLAMDDVSLSTVPEPATVALVGVGLAGVGLVARRRRRTAA